MGTGAVSDIEALDEKVPGLLPMLNTWLPEDFMQPREISNAIVYLASDESAFVTGLSMAVDAGMSLY